MIRISDKIWEKILFWTSISTMIMLILFPKHRTVLFVLFSIVVAYELLRTYVLLPKEAHDKFRAQIMCNQSGETRPDLEKTNAD